MRSITFPWEHTDCATRTSHATCHLSGVGAADLIAGVWDGPGVIAGVSRPGDGDGSGIAVLGDGATTSVPGAPGIGGAPSAAVRGRNAGVFANCQWKPCC